MADAPPVLFNRDLLRRRRARVAAGAVAHDFLLARVAEDLAERVAVVRRRFGSVLELGAHHGVIGWALLKLDNVDGPLVSAEATPALLGRCAGLPVAADEEALPFADGAFDLVVSGLALQLVNDLPGTLAQIRRVLRPDGLALVALVGGESLTELRQSWLAAEAETAGGASPRVAPFVDVRDLGALAQRAGFAMPVVDADTVTVTYASPLAVMAELRAMGAGNVLAARRRVPTRRDTLMRAAEFYAQRFGDGAGRVRTTYEILTLTAWSPGPGQPQPLRPGSATTRLADALGPGLAQKDNRAEGRPADGVDRDEPSSG
jgi:SAM-dependent methyltransferase